MKTINLCGLSALTLFLFSCGSSFYTSSPKKIVPVQANIWRNGVPVHTDTVQNIDVLVQQAWVEESRYVFELRFENKGRKKVEIDPDKFYTLQSLNNGKRMGAYSFTAEDVNRAMNKNRDAQLKSDGTVFMMLLLPLAIIGAVAEGEYVNNMSREDRRAYEQQRTLDRIERNQRVAERNRQREREADAPVTRLTEYYLPPLKRHTLMPGEIHKGRVFFPVLAGADSLKLMLPVNASDTLQFRYSVIR